MTSATPTTAIRPSAPVPVSAIAAKTLLRRRSTLVRKRSDDGDMDFADSAPPSPGKRPKVKFDSAVEVRTVGDEWEKDPAIVREEVRRAIQRHLAGDSELYDRIKDIFSADPRKEGSPALRSVKTHLHGLLACVSLLNKSCNGLIFAVLDGEWITRDEAYVTLFVKFLGNLVAAQSGYLNNVLRMLAKYLGEVRKHSSIPGYPSVQRGQIYTRAHAAIRHVLQVIPSSSNNLAHILASAFPYDSDSAKANVIYTKNLLRLLDYAPELKSGVLTLITDKLVKIDVQVQVDLEDLEDEDSDEIVDAIPDLHNTVNEDEQDESDSDSVMSDEITDPEAVRLKAVKANIIKVDSLIDLLFQYYGPVFASGSSQEQENTLDLLFSHFHTIILPTYRSRHTQFLLFHYGQTNDILVDRFATTCIQLIFDKRKPAILRQSAAAYLASFVARGAHVSAQVVRDVFDLLGNHLETLRAEYESGCRGPNLRRYSSFYCMAQALLYIFCFRWRDLATTVDGEPLDDDFDPVQEDIEWDHSIREPLSCAIGSELNPLMVCSPAIVTEFARISNHLRFLYVYSKIEQNKNTRLATTRSLADINLNQPNRDTGNLGDAVQLDAYFPFDPYQLPRSKRWLEGDYVEWKGIPGLQKEEADTEEEILLVDSDDEDEGAGTGTDNEE